MKVRVCRYWAETDWLYYVEVFRDITEKERVENAMIKAAQAEPFKRGDLMVSQLRYKSLTTPGERWRLYMMKLSRDHALDVARRLSEVTALEGFEAGPDVVHVYDGTPSI